jgi:FHA domain/Zinc-ribbon containing domain
MELLVHEGFDVRAPGEIATGSLVCVGCGYSLSLEVDDELPRCPACGGTGFRRASLFESRTLDSEAISPAAAPPTWLEDVRSQIDPTSRYLAYEEDGDPVTFELSSGWTRIGRSSAADLRLDDATVSRRHALVVRTPEDELRALDDRSLNGLFVNGDKVEWTALADGDELEIGRYRLYVLGG